MRTSPDPRIEEIETPALDPSAPGSLTRFLNDVVRRMQRFDGGPAEYVGSDPRILLPVLRWLREAGQTRGRSFCEWGSGLGGATCLAELLGYEARGIEIDPGLLVQARRLATDHGLTATFHEGNYQPPGIHRGEIDRSGWERALGFCPTAFDVVFVYPWPAEVWVVDQLFADYATSGAILVTYHGGAQVRVRRRCGG